MIITEWIVYVKSKKVERKANHRALPMLANVQQLETVKNDLIGLHPKSTKMKMRFNNALSNFE